MDYILLMHGMKSDEGETPNHPDWTAYIARLESLGVLRGGSAIGRGVCVNQSGESSDISRHLTGYIKIEAETMEAAKALLTGNPVYEAGGTVEIRELPQTS